MEKKSKSTVTIKGSKSDGYIITVYGRDNFVGDIAMTHEEIKALQSLIAKKIK